jgi:DNA-binding transcriptional LysR family regulator
MQVNVRQIEIFKAIMEGGSVTQAAINLNITQPSVSKHLKLLEIGLGFDLFRRRGNKLDVTPEGQALFDQVERVYTGLGFLSDFAEDLRNNQLGELSIASMPLMAQKWLPSCVASFVATHPKVSFSLPVRSSSWIATAVAARRVHFGMGLRPSDADTGIHVAPLIKLPLVCVMAPDHPLAEHTEIQLHHMQDHSLISLASFESQPLVLENLINGTQANGKQRIETFSASVACELAQQKAGIALVDAMTARDNLSDQLTFRPYYPVAEMEICVMTPEHWPLSQIAKNFIEVMIVRARQTEKELSSMITA